MTPKFEPSAQLQTRNSAAVASGSSGIGAPSGSVVSSTNGGEDSSSRYNIVTDKSVMRTSLEIFPVDSADEKYFVCKFKTSSGEAQHVFKLTVQSKYSLNTEGYRANSPKVGLKAATQSQKISILVKMKGNSTGKRTLLN